jgi:hypothetical protein
MPPLEGGPRNQAPSVLIVTEKYPSGVGAVSGLLGLPVPRHEFIDAIDLVIRQALEDRCEPCFGVDVVQLACLHECVGDCGSFAATELMRWMPPPAGIVYHDGSIFA